MRIFEWSTTQNGESFRPPMILIILSFWDVVMYWNIKVQATLI